MQAAVRKYEQFHNDEEKQSKAIISGGFDPLSRGGRAKNLFTFVYKRKRLYRPWMLIALRALLLDFIF